MKHFFTKQRLSFKEKKADDYKVIKDFVNSIIKYHEEDFIYDDLDKEHDGTNKYRRVRNMLSNYRLFNNQLDQSDFRDYCDSIGIKESIGAKIHDIKAYNKTYNKINVLLGEEFRRPDTQRVVLVNPEGVRSKLEKRKEMYKEYIQAEVQMAVLAVQKQYPEVDPSGYKSEEEYQADVQEREAAIQEKVNSVFPPAEIEKYMSTSYLSQKEITAADLLKYLYYKENIKEKKNDGFKHGLISGEEHVWVGIINGEPVVEVLNPIKTFYHKSPEVKYVQDGLYAGYRTDMTIADVLDRFADDLTDKQKDDLENKYTSKNQTNDSNLINKSMTYGDLDTIEYQYSSSDSLSSEGSYGKGLYDDIEVIHIEWVSQRKIGFLEIQTPDGEVIVEKVDESFEQPKYAKTVRYKDENGISVTAYQWDNYSLEWEWIPEVWEATIIDENTFVKIGPKANQYYSPSNPFKVKLGYFGLVYNSMNAFSQSVMDRMKPYQYLFFIFMDKFKQLVAKDKGNLVAIDTSRLDPKFPIEKTIHFLEQAGYYVYNGLQNADMAGGQNRPGVDGIKISNINDIINFSQILAYIDSQIGEAAGVLSSREGGSERYEAVTNVQQNILQSSYITEPYFIAHDYLWKEVKTGLIETAQIAYSKHPLITQYVLNDGSRKFLEIDDEFSTEAEYGIFVSNASEDVQIFETLKSLAQPLLQNDKIEIDDLISILAADSPEELKRELLASKNKRQDREERMAQSQLESQEKMVQMQIEAREDEQEHQIQVERMKIEKDILVAEIQAERFALAQDVNENNVPDQLEIEKIRQKGQLDMAKLNHDSVQQEKNRQVDLIKTRETNQSKEKITRMKPKPSSK
jgi:hypothetical protein